jgi:hypothetical protein
MSMVEPAVNGTIARIGLAGHCCADASCGNAGVTRAAPDNSRNFRRVVMIPSPDV